MKTITGPGSTIQRVYYVDTDAFATPTLFKTSDVLGGLKLEKRIVPDPALKGSPMERVGALFEGPKLYAYHALGIVVVTRVVK